MMKINYHIVLVAILILGCKKPFSQASKTALALPIATVEKTKSVVFIAGFDEGDNTYYTNAKNYFDDQDVQIVENKFSIEQIIQWLNQNNKEQKGFDEIHIVSHSNAWLGMSLKTHEKGERITLKTLAEAKKSNKISPIQNAITNNTKIIFHSCGLGKNKELLQGLKQVFTTTETPKVYASSFFNVFGGRYAAHYLAKPYYGFYPTAESPGPMALSKEFQSSYPESNIDWFTALKTRRETNLGEVYSYKFNIPVDWEITFDDTNNIPQLNDKEAIMDWVSESQKMAEILYNLNVPIEKYRWSSKIRGNTLIIKGKTTVICVLEPILEVNDKNEYQRTVIDDTNLYQIL